jgi:hypothetical protein
VFRFEEDIAGDGERSGDASGFLQELTASGFHEASEKNVSRDQ